MLTESQTLLGAVEGCRSGAGTVIPSAFAELYLVVSLLGAQAQVPVQATAPLTSLSLASQTLWGECRPFQIYISLRWL